MKPEVNLEERKPIWIALSDFYIDNELQDYDFKSIALKIWESPYSIEEVKRINKEEVFPVLYTNLLDVAGVWSGFQEEWLLQEISKNLYKRNRFKRFIRTITYKRLKWMYADYWKKLEEAYKNLMTSE